MKISFLSLCIERLLLSENFFSRNILKHTTDDKNRDSNRSNHFLPVSSICNSKSFSGSIETLKE